MMREHVIQKASLASLAEEPFALAVAEDCHNRLDKSVAVELRDPALTERWFDALVTLKSNLQRQFARRRSDLEALRVSSLREDKGSQDFITARAEFLDWKARSVALLGRVEERLAEAKRNRTEQRETLHSEGRSSRKALLQWAASLILDKKGAGADWHKAYRESAAE